MKSEQILFYLLFWFIGLASGYMYFRLLFMAKNEEQEQFNAQVIYQVVYDDYVNECTDILLELLKDRFPPNEDKILLIEGEVIKQILNERNKVNGRL